MLYHLSKVKVRSNIKKFIRVGKTVVDTETVQEPAKKTDSQPGYLIRKPYSYIYVALTFAFIALIFLLISTGEVLLIPPFEPLTIQR